MYLTENFGLNIQYIKVEENTTSDSISKLDRTDPYSDDVVIIEVVLYIVEDPYEFLLELEIIAAKQAACNTLSERFSLKHHTYISKTIGGVDDIICKDGNIFIPETL